MEMKDLALLLMIPITLGAVLFYAGNAGITGAAVTEGTDKVGEYSILPSFKVKTDYSLDEYKEMKSKLKNIIELCKDNNIEKCLTEESKKLKWECNDKEEKILHKFTDSLNDCMKINERAVCQFAFDEIKGINDIEDERIFEIKLSMAEGKARIELKEKGKLIAEDNIPIKELLYTDTDYTGKDTSKNKVDSIIMRVKYEHNKPEVQKLVALKDWKEIKLFEGFIYKTGEDVKFIDERIKDSFKAPEPANKIIKVPFTKGMKFCAKSKKEVFVYKNEKLEKKNIEYRFSVTFPKPIPAPLENFEALDAVKAEKSAVFVWDAVDEIESYNLYHSSKNFIDMPVKDIKKDSEITKISLQKKDALEIDDIRLTECKFEPYGVKCKYVSYGKSLEANKLYYWKSQNRYIYYLSGIKDDAQYYAAITAVDDEGSEIDNDKTKPNNKMIFTENKNYRQFASKDDLAPMKIADLQPHIDTQKLSWTKPLKNADGTDSADVAYFNIYYKKSTNALSPHIEPGYSTRRITTIEANCANQAIACEYSVGNIPNLEKQIYSFAVTALDENVNEVSEADVRQMLIS